MCMCIKDITLRRWRWRAGAAGGAYGMHRGCLLPIDVNCTCVSVTASAPGRPEMQMFEGSMCVAMWMMVMTCCDDAHAMRSMLHLE
jgi:hypothetical protein